MADLPESKPRVFVGSSSESLEVAYALQETLERDAEVTVWTQGIFALSRTSLQSLVKALDGFDFAVFVFAPDDVLHLRGDEYSAVRDNVVFELGLFLGALGEDRAFILMPSGSPDLRLPSDLLGITPAVYDSQRRDKNIIAALGPAATKLKRAMTEAGSRQKSISDVASVSPTVAAGFSEELRAEVQAMLTEQEARIASAFERMETRFAALLNAQKESAKAPTSRVAALIRDAITPEAQALVRHLVPGGHLTLEQYHKLAAGELKDPLEELRGLGLLVPLRGRAPDGSRVPVYWFPSEIANVVRSVAPQLPASPAIAERLTLVLSASEYPPKRSSA